MQLKRPFSRRFSRSVPACSVLSRISIQLPPHSALDVQVEDNLLDLLPGETRDIAVRGPVDLAALREALKLKTLNDR